MSETGNKETELVEEDQQKQESDKKEEINE